jgi:ubiquitin carboxyl-terminal hydrolase 7
MIIFRPRYGEPDQTHPEFSLVLSKKQNYDTVRRFIHEIDALTRTSL